jgi:hypothetical protein
MQILCRRLLGIGAVLLSLVVPCSSGQSSTAPDTTPTPASTATATPQSTTTPKTTESDDSGLETAATEAFATLQELLDELGPRESATDEESTAARYLQSNFQDLGYVTEIQEFLVEDVALAGKWLTLSTQDSPDPREFAAVPLAGSGLGDVSGVLTPVGLALPGDTPDSGHEGRIGLAKRGAIRSQNKAENVFAAGAVGLVIYNSSSRKFRWCWRPNLNFPFYPSLVTPGKRLNSCWRNQTSRDLSN